MSFDLAVVAASPSATDEETLTRALDLYEVDEGEWPEGPVGEFAVDLLHKWPPLHTLTEDEIDGSPWNGELVLSRDGAILLIAWPRSDEVRFTVLGLARRYGLAVVDFQADKIFRPVDALPLMITTQGHGSFSWVNRDVLVWLVASLHPKAEWLVLEHLNGAYAQTALDADGFVLEARPGGPETHIGTRIAEADEVARRLFLFAQEDPSWQSGREWEHVEL